MGEITIAKKYRTRSVTSTATLTPLRTLLGANVPALTGLIQVRLTPSADLLVCGPDSTVGRTVTGNASEIFPIEDSLDQLKLQNSATVIVELFYDQGS